MTYIKPSKAQFEKYCFDRVAKLCQEYKSNQRHHSFKHQYFLFGKRGTAVLEIYPLTRDCDCAGHIFIEERNTNKVLFSKTYKHHSSLLRGLGNYRIHEGLVGFG